MATPRLVKVPLRGGAKPVGRGQPYCMRCLGAVRRGSTVVETTHGGSLGYVHQKCWQELWLQPPLSVLRKQKMNRR